MKRNMASLESSAKEHLRRLQDPNADRETLLRLLETSCLLELSKLTAAQVDLSTFVTTTVNVLVQFFPVESCAVVLEPEDLPRVTGVFGDPDTDPQRLAARADAEDDSDTIVLRLNALMRPIGYLVVSGLPDFITDANFFATAADQLSAVLGAMIAAEKLRRQAAMATALQLAATLDQGDDDEQLQALVEALAVLPGVVGGRLSVDHPALGAPTHVLAGLIEETWIEHTVQIDEGYVEVRLFTLDGDASEGSLLKVLDILAATLRRMVHERRLVEQVETDPLTGAGNRRRASRSLAAALSRAERTGGSVAALALDLDHFKRVNDTLGHATGDTVLQCFTNLLFEQVRPYDTVARMGGEEFTILCPGLDVVEARSVAERIIAATPAACDDALGPQFRQTVSVGIAIFPNHAEFGEALLRAADGALYEAKRQGRNRVAVAGVAPATGAASRRFS